MAEVCEALGKKTDEIDRLSAIEVIDILQRVMHDVALWHATKQRRFTAGWPQLVEKLGAAALPEAVLEYQKSLESLRAIALHPLNQRLFLESVFVQSPYSKPL